jgi:WD40 repeat protein
MYNALMPKKPIVLLIFSLFVIRAAYCAGIRDAREAVLSEEIAVPAELEVFPQLGAKIFGHYRMGNMRNFVLFTPDGSKILSSINNSVMKLWDAEAGAQIGTFSAGNGAEYRRTYPAAISNDGKMIISAHYVEKNEGLQILVLWDIDTGQIIRTYSPYYDVSSLSFTHDDRQILCAEEPGWVSLIDTATGESIIEYPGEWRGHHWAGPAALSPDGLLTVIATGRGIKLYNTFTGEEIRTFIRNVPFGSSHLAFSSDGSFIISLVNGFQLIDTATGDVFGDFEIRHRFYVSSVALSPDSSMIVSSGADNMIKLWDVKTGELIRTLNGHSSYVDFVTFSPDGRFILSGANDGTVRLWNADTGEQTASFIGYPDGEWVVITPDGYYNASAKGEKYLSVRAGENVYGIENYRSIYNRPDIVQARLRGGN